VLVAVLTILVSAFASPALASTSREHGARHRSAPAVNRASVAPTLPTNVQGANHEGEGGGLAANFNGVSSRDSYITNFNLAFEPPDQGLCVGNGFVVEMVNSAFRIYDTHGNTLSGPTNVNAPFHDDFAAFTSDPRCHYDSATNTWFAVVLFINDPGTEGRLDIAYNTSGDPTTDWSVFRIDTTHAGAPASFNCPCFGDQPRLGIDGSNVYITTDEFSIQGIEFNGAQIYAISKNDLVRHSRHIHFVHYTDLFIGGTPAFSVQPALTFGPAPAEYFLSSLDPNGTGDNRIGVWALTNVDRVSNGGRPRLSSVLLTTEPYANPPDAAQKGSDTLIATNDDRMQQTQFINGEIWGELNTAIVPADDTAVRAGAAWFRVKPQLSGSKLTDANVTRQGYLVSQGNYILFPAVQADAQGHAAMVFTLTGPDMYPSAAYATLEEGESGFGRPVVASAGSGPYVATPRRWGDYSWAVLDPQADSVWMATEYMPPTSSQTPTGRRPWGTRVFLVELH
jgi:hypothetical protein